MQHVYEVKLFGSGKSCIQGLQIRKIFAESHFQDLLKRIPTSLFLLSSKMSTFDFLVIEAI